MTCIVNGQGNFSTFFNTKNKANKKPIKKPIYI